MSKHCCCDCGSILRQPEAELQLAHCQDVIADLEKKLATAIAYRDKLSEENPGYERSIAIPYERMLSTMKPWNGDLRALIKRE